MDNKKYWRDLLGPYTIKSNAIAVKQLLVTIIPYFLIWFLYIETLKTSVLFAIPLSILMAFFLLRCFVLMHDCGHGSLFNSVRANKIIGYLLGVITGMPQYVWSKHHAYHHTTNGNWEKYQGPLSIISTKAFAELNSKQQKNYEKYRHPSLALLAGFVYVLFNPRVNWFLGCLQLIWNFLSSLFFLTKSGPIEILKKCESKYWKTPKEFLHMTYNNIALLTLWVVMCESIGVFNFFIFYTLSVSLSGGLGILFFTVQHNFEHSYASDTENTDYFKAALEGSSYLKLPFLLNWFTGDIAYHHIHHLSTSVPNYRLASCHHDLKEHFTNVKRISLRDIPKSIKYLLWDSENEMIVSVAEFRLLQLAKAREQKPLSKKHLRPAEINL